MNVISVSDRSKLIWSRVWAMEDEGHDIMCGKIERRPLIYNVTDKPCCLTWWAISLVDKGMINDCGVMSSLVWNANRWTASDCIHVL